MAHADGFNLYHYRATVVRVIDGDTAWLRIDHGKRIYSDDSFRIVGMNAPEINKGTFEERAEGGRSKAELERLVGPPGSPVYVETLKDTQSFGRYLARVYAPGESGELIDVAAAMVASGHATRG